MRCAREPIVRSSDGRLLHISERGNEVLDEVVRMLKSAREPHQSIADAKLRACGRREALMRGRCRMRNQALGVAEIVADLDELERVLKRKAPAFSPLTSNATSVEPACICRRTTAAWG